MDRTLPFRICTDRQSNTYSSSTYLDYYRSREATGDNISCKSGLRTEMTEATQRQHLGLRDRIKTVAIVGGTHGNEASGIALARHYKKLACERVIEAEEKSVLQRL